MTVSGVPCIVFAVSSARIRWSPKAPFCRCAIMKRAISAPVAASEPAGAIEINS